MANHDGITIAYVRVSTETQATEGGALQAQRNRIAAWCTAHEYTEPQLFVDAGLSGSRSDNRPELQKALSAVVECKGVLLIFSLSRLARSTKDTIQISERLEKAGCNLVSLSENIDTTSAAGKMVFRMLAVLAEFERDLVSERTKAALAYKKSQGKRVGKVPFGFDLCTDGESLVENDGEQASLSRIHDMRSQGMSLRRIAQELRGLGIRTKEGKETWSAKVVRSQLNRIHSKDGRLEPEAPNASP